MGHTVTRFIGPPPRYVYAPRGYTADECVAARARVHDLAGDWATAPPGQDPLPEVAEDGSDAAPASEPPPRERRRRPPREPGRPVTIPAADGELTWDRFMRTGRAEDLLRPGWAGGREE